jgi:hypothetical protein
LAGTARFAEFADVFQDQHYTRPLATGQKIGRNKQVHRKSALGGAEFSLVEFPKGGFAGECLVDAVANDTILAQLSFTATVRLGMDALEGFTAATMESQHGFRTKELLGGRVEILNLHVLIDNKGWMRKCIKYGPYILGHLLFLFPVLHIKFEGLVWFRPFDTY